MDKIDAQIFSRRGNRKGAEARDKNLEIVFESGSAELERQRRWRWRERGEMA